MKKFSQFIAEGMDREEEIRLRELGISDISNKSFDERINALTEEWSSDPEINKALDILKSRTTEIIDKWTDYDQDETEFDQFREELTNDWSIDELGFLEYMIASGNY